MRVLVLTQYYRPEVGGAQTRLAAFAAELRARGHTVHVITAMPHHLLGRVYAGYRGKAWMHERIDGVDVSRTWVYAASGTGMRRVLNYLSFTMTSVFAALAAPKADLVFVESPPLTLGLSGLVAAFRHRAPMVLNVSDLWPDSVRDLGVITGGPVLRAAEWLEGFLYRHAAAVTAVTRTIERTLETAKGVPAEKILFLPNGVDLERFAPRAPDRTLRDELGLNGLPVLLYAGTHGIGMGLEHVLAAARLLEGQATVLFVGDGPTKAKLVAQAQAEGIRSAVFVDPVPLPEMARFLSVAHAAVVPLVRSGVTRGARPSKLFPALASGVPVIYSGEGEGAELVVRSGAGIAVEPESGPAIAAAMRRLIAEPSDHARMANAARRLAESTFSWGTIVERWLRDLESRGVAPRTNEGLQFRTADKHTM